MFITIRATYSVHHLFLNSLASHLLHRVNHKFLQNVIFPVFLSLAPPLRPKHCPQDPFHSQTLDQLTVMLLHTSKFVFSYMYILTYLLTSWSRVLLEKLAGLQLVNNFPVFYETRKFITVFTSARHLSLA